MGLVPRRRVDGMTCNFQVRQYYIPATDTNVMRPGDPVVKTSGLADAAGLPAVTLATAGASNRLTGVIVGFRPTPTIIANGGIRAAGIAEYVLVCDDPEVLFEVQEDGTTGGGATGSTAAPVTIVGKNANLVAGTGYVQRSGWQLSANSVSTSATGQLNIIEVLNQSDNAPGTPYLKLLVRINQHTETPASAGI